MNYFKQLLDRKGYDVNTIKIMWKGQFNDSISDTSLKKNLTNWRDGFFVPTADNRKLLSILLDDDKNLLSSHAYNNHKTLENGKWENDAK